MKRSLAGLAATLVVALGLTACSGSGDPMGSPTPQASAAGALVVGSANFPESQLLAELYAGALAARGYQVETRLGIGSRETYIPALQDGSIDLIPEYTGALARYFNPDASATDPEGVLAELRAALPAGLEVLEPAAAEDKDAVVMTRARASELGVSSIADLAGKASDLVIGGPPEWETRDYGIPGLQAAYGITFREFRKLDAGGPLAVQALKNGQVDAANIFTTDPAIQVNDFVALEDPLNFFAAQNVVPLVVADRVDAGARAALDAVSAQLTTEDLTGLLKQVTVDKRDADDVAAEYLAARSLA